MERYRFGQRESRDRGGRLAACRVWRRRLQPGKSRSRPLDPDQQHIGLGRAGQSVPWANAGTGSRGSITGLAELKDKGQTCRRFKASRESFDGVAMFEGELCLAGAGGWRMQDFKAL